MIRTFKTIRNIVIPSGLPEEMKEPAGRIIVKVPDDPKLENLGYWVEVTDTQASGPYVQSILTDMGIRGVVVFVLKAEQIQSRYEPLGVYELYGLKVGLPKNVQRILFITNKDDVRGFASLLGTYASLLTVTPEKTAVPIIHTFYLEQLTLAEELFWQLVETFANAGE